MRCVAYLLAITLVRAAAMTAHPADGHILGDAPRRQRTQSLRHRAAPFATMADVPAELRAATSLAIGEAPAASSARDGAPRHRATVVMHANGSATGASEVVSIVAEPVPVAVDPTPSVVAEDATVPTTAPLGGEEAGAGAANVTAAGNASAPELQLATTVPYSFTGFAAAWLWWLALTIVFGKCCYEPGKHPEAPGWITQLRKIAHKPDPEYAFNHDHFNCLHDWDLMCLACFCPGLRWADTMHMAKLGSFGALFTLFACATFIAYFFPGSVVLLLVYFRQQLRQKIGVPSWTCSSCCSDFWYALFCPWCLIVHEARVTNEACLVGNPLFVWHAK